MVWDVRATSPFPPGAQANFRLMAWLSSAVPAGLVVRAVAQVAGSPADAVGASNQTEGTSPIRGPGPVALPRTGEAGAAGSAQSTPLLALSRTDAQLAHLTEGDESARRPGDTDRRHRP